ncbi:MAG: hypothetical protein JWP10_896, partial [Nocardioidaceae bacterium]|nr:hypothetical protein [Nocardioidaceae bacterium]
MPQFVPDEVGHLDIAGPDLAKLTAFYTAVFDWEISPRGPGCSMVTTPGSGPNAALVEAETSSIVAGIVVSDLAASIAKALEGGGREVMPP